MSSAGSETRADLTACRLESLDSHSWDAFAAVNEHGAYAQTSFYGRFEEAVNEYAAAHFLSARQDGQTTGQLLAIEKFDYELLFQRPGIIGRLGAWPAALFRSLSWNYGPLCSGPHPRTDTLASLLAGVDALARERNAFMVRHALPPVHGWDSLAGDYRETFGRFGYRTRRKATVLLNVAGRSLDELWDGLDKDSRRVVRKARKQGVEVVEAASGEHIEAFHRIRLETARRNNFRLPDKSHFEEIRRIFPPDVYRILLTRHEGNWVSGQGLGVSNGNLILGGVGYSDYARENRIYGNDLMQWHVIEWAHGQGARVVDWVGYFLEPRNEGEKGVNHFKLKWGGEVVEYDEFYKVYGPLRHGAVQLARKLFG
ncbi:MAG: peptidoglycan bridge formation glycyltransferase FemA/FemB family protein [Candidatus Glassbacteria bacterium]|nr:peptidoglycan bridge formation glycyltransferase FemA/FemB family protein [Candidatus Glassbacteria bacterium]